MTTVPSQQRYHRPSAHRPRRRLSVLFHSPHMRTSVMHTFVARLTAATLVAVTTFTRPVAAQAGGAPYDIILRGGTVVDGTGAPRYRADVAIEKGELPEFGRRVHAAPTIRAPSGRRRCLLSCIATSQPTMPTPIPATTLRSIVQT